jgi:hypothetical protein
MYDNGTHIRPVILRSTDNGSTWIGVITSSVTLPTDILGDAIGNTVHCQGDYCTLTGRYLSTQMRPLILNSSDNGLTWTAYNNVPLPTDFTYGFIQGIN